jgi:hypothetical protein
VKTLFKLGIILLVANALFRFIPPYWRNHEFQSEVQHASLKWRNLSDAAVMEDVLSVAASRNVPITAQNVTIQRDRDRLHLRVAYDVPIELLPSMSRPWTFTSEADAEVLRHAVSPPR